MRFAALLLVGMCLASPLFAVEPEETTTNENTSNEATTSETVQFDGQSLDLAFEDEDSDATIKEFLPAGEKLESWTRLAAIRQFNNMNDPVTYATATLKDLKEKYPQSPSAVVEDPKTGAVILDFVVWPEDASFAEFNVFRYQPREGGGLVSQQYALRAYGDKAESFLLGLREVRERLVKKMTDEGLQLEATTSARDESPQE